MSLWQLLLLVGAALVGGGIALSLKANRPQTVKIILAFAGAYILGITTLHLLPEMYEVGGARLGVYVLTGFLLQLLLDYFTGGLEHGHIHYDSKHRRGGIQLIGVMIGLSIHAFLEGMPIYVYDLFHEAMEATAYPEREAVVSEAGHNHLLWGVLIHKAPEAFALTLLLTIAQVKQRALLFVLFLFSLMTPAGAVLAAWLRQSEYLALQDFSVLTAIVTGSFLHISTTILFEAEDNHHHFNWRKLASVLAGFGLSLLTMH